MAVYVRRAKKRRKKHVRQPRLARLYDKQNGLCFYCGEQMIVVDTATLRRLPPKAITQDHLLPKSKGGTRAAHNIVGACWQCNHRRGTDDWAEFKARFAAPLRSDDSKA